MKNNQVNLEVYNQMYLGKLGELTLKGSNVKVFEKQLLTNVKYALSGLPAKMWLSSGRLYIACKEECCAAVEYALDHLIGITGWAKVRCVEKTIDAIKAAVREEGLAAKASGAKSFKIDARREDKAFELNSYEIAIQAAGVLFDDNTLAVDVHHPDAVINVEVRDKCYVYCAQKKTCRGLPVGVSGKGLLLLSGGIDSPVAGYRMMRRGMKVDCIYFHSYPYTSEEAQKKVEDLAKIIGQFGVETYLNVIPFTQVQMHIKSHSPENYSTLMLRLCMMKCANLLAPRTGAQAIITGESLGQVASQTNENMACTESFAEYPLYRPLIGLDKEEIINTAEFLGTYPISILPYEDCCVLFSPRHPVLRAPVEEAKRIYDEMKIDELVQKAFDERKIIHFSIQDSIKEQFGQ
ncbi:MULTISPECIES: tRNA uracil 4-sulfurtransferase ThiI [Treponema]|uniref:Probable tRNA sulfurtransferase n=1 Tax=Treponema rectale TaxID=744512 RepID=A0A840SFJ2_9SPIR|nr:MULTISPECIES: tRNA uracil 4-sulfurtransferase ThiI [Treponema]MBB5218212.1 thiamine biosynthesis protein ThiI [Treponema rectale]MBE6354408.1 tRNA 4-thiouridine(8) synthase ThiI [Treponema sp.]QOS40084.1 tRNA 4-thiouridine(8) synthase ThiI [Treponema rectale]